MKEYYFLKFFQIVILLNTFAFGIGFILAIKGRINLHKKIQGIAIIITLAGAVGLVVTVLSGWDYSGLTTHERMTIHRSFSSPLLLLLIAAAIAGLKKWRKTHLAVVYTMIPFWFGALITGWWYFW